MWTKMKTVQEHFLNTLKALKPTENVIINACVFIIARQFLEIEYLLRPDMPMKYNLSCITVMSPMLCSIAERTSYMHAGEIILRGGDIGHRRYWTTWLRRERRGNLTLVNYPEGLAKCRGHCSNILYINMLAIEHEEYSILISETFGQADRKLN
ncbi:hypothetical protein T4D_12266 [Trichinella pseudospiralis]|uniref:Uncharacterized protein n=1 Tax=Trichinella pseudospiralis TaxID=6337 RepID=A0A0V1F3J3_TRIPS|nr:hypothetical protein T4D_12266 [Trichinella pseudospiralis]